MHTILIYSVTLMIAVLFSDLARRSVMSTSVLFLLVGIVSGATGWVSHDVSHPVTRMVAEIALVATLFSDSLNVPLGTLRRAWALPGRALLLGLPMTLGATAVLAHFLCGLTWLDALLVAAALSPTDPVLASAIVGEARVPERLRHLLNVESGLNDGLALPAVVVLLSRLKSEHVSSLHLGGELIGGVLLGIIIPIVAVRIYRLKALGAAPLHRPLFGLAVGMIVWSVTSVVGGNVFLASFAAGITLATISGKAREFFAPVGERLSELLKFAALLVFGVVLAPQAFVEVGWTGWVFAAAVLLVARPIAILIALIRSNLPWREQLTAAWFGPRGFASVVFGLMILDSDIPHAEAMFHLVAITIALSIAAHSSTDVLVSRWFHADDQHQPPGPPSAADAPPA